MNEFCVMSIALNSTLSTHNASPYSGGEGGIRTHGTVSRSQHFQCCQFNHSCTSPDVRYALACRCRRRLVATTRQAEAHRTKISWRRGWDSNPRRPLSLSGFRDRCTNPLCDLSAPLSDKLLV